MAFADSQGTRIHYEKEATASRSSLSQLRPPPVLHVYVEPQAPEYLLARVIRARPFVVRRTPFRRGKSLPAARSA
jgi:hypothetical protein